ncbi:putative MFS family arabinose efflux permease [Lentzea flaviverrucosa]|uniref:Predicted arabinose efflux permease, MFS family n=2 Tax=Lentzea flaviverrucosa TaxID=200379 RepID=A0A1H9ITF2_9PSEU|nr:MFS transporter [Lentzea flaviverrucosa]RDI16755.1 putative MFS family arabinose efflux permease [Lentzea flaviverrucosa]SEQ77826.1 Predicted arabinose efflux permease, MFS family [Lentzea flaviverrucosa]
MLLEETPPVTRPNVVVAVLALGGITVSLMQTLVIPLLPRFPALLNSSPGDTAWVITSTLLASAVATPVVGRLGDMYGKRRMLLVSLLMLVAGSVIAALSYSLVPLIIGRVVQGLAVGVIPLGISIMRDELPLERLAGATALMSASLGVGGALGLPAAALLVEQSDWHMLFWTSAAAGVLVLVAVLVVVPESPVRGGGRFDFLGALGLSVALICLLLGVSKASTWSGATTTGLFVVAAVVLGLWGWWELRSPQPLVDLRTTARRQVLLTNIASAVFAFAMFAQSLVLPQILQLPASTGHGLGQSLLVTGLVLVPSGLVMMATAPLSAKISNARGPRVTLILGALVVALGYGAGVFMLTAVWQLVVVSAVIGAGIGLGYGAMPALIMGAVPTSETAAANSLNTLMRAIGTSVSSAVAGVVLTQVGVPFSFQLIMGLGAATALLAVVVAAFIPPARPVS